MPHPMLGNGAFSFRTLSNQILMVVGSWIMVGSLNSYTCHQAIVQTPLGLGLRLSKHWNACIHEMSMHKGWRIII
jgi:hypothetical protein